MPLLFLMIIIGKKNKGPVNFSNTTANYHNFSKLAINKTNLFASPGSDVPVKEHTRGDILNWDTISYGNNKRNTNLLLAAMQSNKPLFCFISNKCMFLSFFFFCSFTTCIVIILLSIKQA